MQTIKAEAKRLYDLGFAIHWLKKKSKAPVKSGWTTGPREPWANLVKGHVEGYNVGVRLGTPSRVDGKYLAVIDLDVKSEVPGHQDEMLAKLKELLPELPDDTARVLTGRGNGSSHVYILTPKPVKPRRLAQSVDKVKVHMPSADKPSRFEQETLTAEELGSGVRLRAAWEIALMGEGQQVVLPPSIHQDTGRAYVWQNKLESHSDITRLAFEEKGNEATLSVKNDFKAVAVDLEFSSLPAQIIEGLMEGEGVEDRSAFMLKAAIAMVRAGFSDNEMASVFTDPDTFIGQVSYEHAKTTSRARAAQWAHKYCIVKARREADARFQFDNEVTTEVLASPGEVEQQAVELLTPADWRNNIDRVQGNGQNAGRPRATYENTRLILQNAVSFKLFCRNEFAATTLYGVDTPWGGRVGHELRDLDIVLIKDWIAAHFRYEPQDKIILDAVTKIANDNKFHPVRDYLNALSDWDGRCRVENFLETYFNAAGDPRYLRAVSRKVLCAMIARILEPGTKFDYVLILEGNQGIGKSTAIRALSGDKWFTDAHINISDKDGVLALQSVWLVELGELGGMRKADADQLKEFISRTTDRIRLPYGKLVETFPRQCVFIGTTNSAEYLKDMTGNRRFWPVEVGFCDFEAIRRDRDQILAEAMWIWQNLGEPLYLEDKAVNALAMVEQEQRVFTDTIVEKLEEYLAHDQTGFDVNCFSTGDLFKVGPLMDMREDRQNQMRVAEALRSLGFDKTRTGDERKRAWVPGPKWVAHIRGRMNGNGKDPHHAEAVRPTLTNLTQRLVAEKVQ